MCRPNPCPDLRERIVTNGHWKCLPNENDDCENKRTGETCQLTCKKPFKVNKTYKLFLKLKFHIIAYEW